MGDIVILDPTACPNVPEVAMASRVACLDGIRVGFLDNSKPNAEFLIGRVRALLESRCRFHEVVWQRKRIAADAADEEVVRVLSRAQAVVNGVGD